MLNSCGSFFIGGVYVEEELLFKLLGNIGVPAAICFYTLFGVNKTLKDLTSAINKLTTDVDKREAEQSHEIARLKDKVNELAFKVENLLRKD